VELQSVNGRQPLQVGARVSDTRKESKGGEKCEGGRGNQKSKRMLSNQGAKADEHGGQSDGETAIKQQTHSVRGQGSG